MNEVTMVGNVTKASEDWIVTEFEKKNKKTGEVETQKVVKFTVAINRTKEHADFIPVVAFGRVADFCLEYVKKGSKVAIVGAIQTGSYEKNGKTVYTTEVRANKVEFAPQGGFGISNVTLLGNLTRDPFVHISEKTNKKIVRFTTAVSKEFDRDSADFPNILCFGKTADFVEQYVKKGWSVSVVGTLRSGSYEKDGEKVYTLDVVADKIEVNRKKDDKGSSESDEDSLVAEMNSAFVDIAEDCPF